MGFSCFWLITDLDMSCSKPNTNLEINMSANLSTFLIIDGIFMKIKGILDYPILGHHIVGFLCFTSSAYLQYNMGYMGMILWAAEITGI